MEYHNYIYLTAMKFKISKTLYVFFSKFKYFRNLESLVHAEELSLPACRGRNSKNRPSGYEIQLLHFRHITALNRKIRTIINAIGERKT